MPPSSMANGAQKLKLTFNGNKNWNGANGDDGGAVGGSDDE